MKTMIENTTGRSSEVLKRIAVNEGISVQDVQFSIICAMADIMFNGSPKARSFLASVPCAKTLPTPEEFIAWIIIKAEKNTSVFKQ